MRRVQAGETVAAAARDLLVGWQTVMRAVIAYGQPLVDDPDRLAGVAGLGVDEHVWTHASPSRRTGYATGIVDLTPGQPARLLDVVAGRSGQVYTDWIAEREQQWREQIRRRARSIPRLHHRVGHHTARGDPGTRRVPRRPASHPDGQRDPPADPAGHLGHRGRKGDPLYEIRRLLHRGIETLSDAQRRQVTLGLQVSDPPYAVTVA
jgi:hypothetical protein